MHTHDLLLSRPDEAFGLNDEQINTTSSTIVQHCNFINTDLLTLDLPYLLTLNLQTL